VSHLLRGDESERASREVFGEKERERSRVEKARVSDARARTEPVVLKRE